MSEQDDINPGELVELEEYPDGEPEVQVDVTGAPAEESQVEDAQPDASQDDHLVQQTDNGPEPGAQDPPQEPDAVPDDQLGDENEVVEEVPQQESVAQQEGGGDGPQ